MCGGTDNGRRERGARRELHLAAAKTGRKEVSKNQGEERNMASRKREKGGRGGEVCL